MTALVRFWLFGEESLEAEVAGSLLAETVLLHRLWLKAQSSGGKDRKSRSVRTG